MSTRDALRSPFPWLVVAAILVVASTLRAPILAVTPVLTDVQHDLGATSATVALLTTIPVLLFAALTPVAAILIRRAGPELAIFFCLSAVIVGSFVRLVPGFAWMLAGTAVIGIGIAVGNVVVPVVIHRDVPSRHVAAVTAAYAAMLNVGSLVVTLGMVPVADAIGWPLAVLAVSAFAVAALVLWLLHWWRRTLALRAGADTRADAVDAPRRDVSEGATDEAATLTGPVPTVSSAAVAPGGGHRLVWLLAFTFACQTAVYYGLSTWLPTMLVDTVHTSAAVSGVIAGIFQGAGIAGAFLVPLIARRASISLAAVIVSVSWLAVTLGFFFAPSLYVLWASIGGIAHGGGFVVIMTVLVRISRSQAAAASGSAIVQGVGYLVGALGAPVLGAVHEATGSWSMPILITVALTTMFTVLLTMSLRLARLRR